MIECVQLRASSAGATTIMAKGWAIQQCRYDAMKIDKYFEHRCYSKTPYREVRCKINKFLIQDSGVEYEVTQIPHKEKKQVQVLPPQQVGTLDQQ